jgi:hypothetical protein
MEKTGNRIFGFRLKKAMDGIFQQPVSTRSEYLRVTLT